MSTCTNELNGVYLTEECQNTLKNLQQNGNSLLHNQLEVLSDAIEFVAKQTNGDSDKEALRLISELAYIRGEIKDLQKPY